MATVFDNHSPIDFSEAKVIASCNQDGGCYDGIGYDIHKVIQGTNYHLVHYYSSGCEYNNRVDHQNNYLGCFATWQEVIDHLLKEDPCPWVNELLTDLGYEGERA